MLDQSWAEVVTIPIFKSLENFDTLYSARYLPYLVATFSTKFRSLCRHLGEFQKKKTFLEKIKKMV